MKNVLRSFSVRMAQMASGLLVAGLAFGQTGNYKDLPNITLSNANRSARTSAVSASGNGSVKFIMGKPEPSRGACVRVRAEILRNGSPVQTDNLELCDSRSREIQTSHSGGAQYALQLTKLDQWVDRSVRFSAMKVFYPTNNQPLTLNIPGTLMQLAAGNVQSRDFTVPGAGSLVIRTKWNPNVPVQTFLQRTSGATIAQQNGSQGMATLTASVPAGGTYRIAVRNASTSSSTQASIDRVEFTPSN